MVDVHNSKGPNYNLNRLGAKYFRCQIDKKMFEDIVSGLVNSAEEQKRCGVIIDTQKKLFVISHILYFF